MIKKLVLSLVLGLCSAAAAHAAGPAEIRVDPVTLEARLVNTGTDPFAFPGYQITCETGCLNPSAYLYIDDQYNSEDDDVVAFIRAKLGRRGVLGKGTNDNANLISELTTGTSPVLQAGDSLPLGKPFSGTPGQLADLIVGKKLLSTFAQEKGTDVVSVTIDIVVPEPSTLVLAGLAVGGLALVARRRS